MEPIFLLKTQGNSNGNSPLVGMHPIYQNLNVQIHADRDLMVELFQHYMTFKTERSRRF